MTRTEIVAEAARRLGDTSAEFLVEVNAAFDFVLGDLALEGCIEDLRDVHSGAVTVEGQWDYPSEILCGGNVPSQVRSIIVPEWGARGLLVRLPDRDFNFLRAGSGPEITGQPQAWRTYPNVRQVQLWPPASAEFADAALEVEFLRAPSSVAGGEEITEVRFEDLETIVYGLMARGVGFKDQTAIDLEAAFASYIAGRQRMYARAHNAPSVQTIVAHRF